MEDHPVTGIGGVFLKCKNPGQMRDWYQKHLGIASGEEGTSFEWISADGSGKSGATAWALFPGDSHYFDPSGKPVMINYRVRDLESLVGRLKDFGIETLGEIQQSDYGKFAWIMDPEGFKIELWEPSA